MRAEVMLLIRAHENDALVGPADGFQSGHGETGFASPLFAHREDTALLTPRKRWELGSWAPAAQFIRPNVF